MCHCHAGKHSNLFSKLGGHDCSTLTPAGRSSSMEEGAALPSTMPRQEDLTVPLEMACWDGVEWPASCREGQRGPCCCTTDDAASRAHAKQRRRPLVSDVRVTGACLSSGHAQLR